MTKRLPRSKPTWTDVKAKLAGFDRIGLMGLIQDLYAAQKDNRTFLHTRFGLGEDVLKPYKETLDRWLSPDVLRNQDISVAKAKKAISDYRKAVGEPAGLAELMVLYCEKCCWLFQRCRLPGWRLFLCCGPNVRRGSQSHSPATCKRPRRPNRSAAPCAYQQPRSGIWPYRCLGLPACRLHPHLSTLRHLVVCSAQGLQVGR